MLNKTVNIATILLTVLYACSSFGILLTNVAKKSPSIVAVTLFNVIANLKTENFRFGSASFTRGSNIPPIKSPIGLISLSISFYFGFALLMELINAVINLPTRSVVFTSSLLIFFYSLIISIATNVDIVSTTAFIIPTLIPTYLEFYNVSP
jgi:hypothetical protein